MSIHQHDDGPPHGHPPGSQGPPPGIITMVPLDSTNLHELYLWLRVAQKLVGEHSAETLEIAKSVYPESSKADVDEDFLAKTIVRLGEFTTALGEVIDEIRLAQAQTELDATDIEKVH